MAKILQIKGWTAEQIKSEFSKEKNYKVGMKLNAVYQVAKGMSSRKLVEFYNVSFKQILNWVHSFEKEGVEGLKDKPGRGRKPRLSQDQRRQLAELIEKESPMNYGYNTDTWTGPLLIDWIDKHFNIKYKKAQIYNIIKSLGLSYQKSRGVYPEADPKAQKSFKEDLKKTSGMP